MLDLLEETANNLVMEILSDINEIYADEANFNNADTTSGQRVYTHAQIEEKLLANIKRILNK